MALCTEKAADKMALCPVKAADKMALCPVKVADRMSLCQVKAVDKMAGIVDLGWSKCPSGCLGFEMAVLLELLMLFLDLL